MKIRINIIISIKLFIALLGFSSLAQATTINNDDLTTDKNQPLHISAQELLENDSSSDGKTLKITYVDDWVNGQLSFDLAAGSFKFTPVDDFVGQASFIYGAKTDDGEMGYAKVIIDVADSKSSLAQVEALKDKFKTTVNTSIKLSLHQLLSNDTSINNEALSLTYLGDEKNGTVVYDEKRSTLLFTPDNDFSGQATFVYAVESDNSSKSYASVFVDVIDTNVPASLPDASAVTDIFYLGNMSALTYSMQSMVDNIGDDFGYQNGYDYQLGGFSFPFMGR